MRTDIIIIVVNATYQSLKNEGLEKQVASKLFVHCFNLKRITSESINGTHDLVHCFSHFLLENALFFTLYSFKLNDKHFKGRTNCFSKQIEEGIFTLK